MNREQILAQAVLNNSTITINTTYDEGIYKYGCRYCPAETNEAHGLHHYSGCPVLHAEDVINEKREES